MAVTFRPRRPLFNINARVRTPQEVALADLQVGMQQIRLDDLELQQQKQQKYEYGLQMINENPMLNADEKGIAFVELQKSIFPEEAMQSQTVRAQRVNRLTLGTDITTPEMTQALDTWQEIAVSRGSERAFKEIGKAVQQSNLRYGIKPGTKVTAAQLRLSAAVRLGEVQSRMLKDPDLPEDVRGRIDPQSMTAQQRKDIIKYAPGYGFKNISRDIIFLGSSGDLGISTLEEATIPLREVQADRPARDRFQQYVTDADRNYDVVLDEYIQRINNLDTSMLPGIWQGAFSTETGVQRFFEGDAEKINKLQKESPELYNLLVEMYLLITGQLEKYAQSRVNREQRVRGINLDKIDTGNRKPEL